MAFWCWKGKKWPKMTKNYVCWTLYFRNHMSYDLHLWYTVMFKRVIFPRIFFFIFFQNFDFWVVKAQKMALNDRQFCQSHSVSQEPYIVWLWFLVHMCKWWYLQQIFSFFKILIFWVFRGDKRSKKWPKITNLSMFCSISQEL